jgi:hypothetical protein
MTVYGVWVINKAGGLIFQRNYGGKPLLPLTFSSKGNQTIDIKSLACSLSLRRPSCRLHSGLHRHHPDGIAQLSANEYLVMAGTLHGVHAITSRIAPVAKSSGVQTIESESFKMTIHMTLTGTYIFSFTNWSPFETTRSNTRMRCETDIARFLSLF